MSGIDWVDFGIGYIATSIMLLIAWAVKEHFWPCPVIKDANESDGDDPHLVRTVLKIGNTRAVYPKSSRSARVRDMHDPMGA